MDPDDYVSLCTCGTASSTRILHRSWCDLVTGQRTKVPKVPLPVSEETPPKVTDKTQFVELEIAKAWERWCEVIPDHQLDDPDGPVWEHYRRGAIKLAEKLWARRQQRESSIRKREIPLDDDALPTGPDPLAESLTEEIIQRLEDSVSLGRRPIVRLLLSGNTQAAISRATGISVDSVHDCIGHIRRRAKELMDP